ncbi:MAG: 5'/3'-nucleotidase SurE [Ilumatobacteraceae bacterium]
MRILVTNDDGIDSVGLHVLAQAMCNHGDVVVVAPDREFSGASASVGALHLMRPEVRRVPMSGVPEVWTLNGPPALCVMFARLGAFGPPFDLVVSGINPGANVGRAVYHSGTIGACLTARIGGISGVAVSQAVTGFGIEGQGWDEMIADQRWGTAATVADAFVGALVADLPAEPVVANLNVPNLPIEQVAGWTEAEVGLVPPRAVSTAILEPIVGHEDAYNVRMAWGDVAELPPESDGAVIRDDRIAVSYLTRLVAERRSDLPGPEAALDGLLGGVGRQLTDGARS